MKKLIAVAVAALSLGAFADDSYLYWMTPTSVSWTGTDDTSGLTYDYVAIGVMDNSTGKNVAYLANTTYGTAAMSGNIAVEKSSGSWYASLSEYASNSYSFYIELLNDKGFVGRSTDVLAYSAAEAYVTTFGTQAPSATAWSSTSFTTAAIPEPTSGLLMLFGLSALALRRKRPLKA